MTKIVELIGESKYAIHDLSRLKSTKKGELFRLNMPFELGLDVGCRTFGGAGMKQRKCLILEEQKFRFQAALSDLSGSDIAAHKNDPAELVYRVRDWISTLRRKSLPGGAKVWAAFNTFMYANYRVLKVRGFSEQQIAELSASELVVGIKKWVRENPN